jgi:hypothetical protein
MTFPTGTSIATANLDSSDDDPSLARADLYNLVVAVNQLIASANIASGVLVLDGSGKVGVSYLPSTFSQTGTLALQPSAGIVSVNRVLRLSQTYTADLGSATGTTSPTAGDICYLVDGDAGQPCVGIYNGSAWKVLRLMTTVGAVGAALTSSSTLTATAVP